MLLYSCQLEPILSSFPFENCRPGFFPIHSYSSSTELCSGDTADLKACPWNHGSRMFALCISELTSQPIWARSTALSKLTLSVKIHKQPSLPVLPLFLGLTLSYEAFFIGPLCQRHIKGLSLQEISASFRSLSLTGTNTFPVQKVNRALSLHLCFLCRWRILYFLYAPMSQNNQRVRGDTPRLPIISPGSWHIEHMNKPTLREPSFLMRWKGLGAEGRAAENLGSQQDMGSCMDWGCITQPPSLEVAK